VVPTIPVKNADGTWWDSDEYDQGNPVRNQDFNKFPRKSGLMFVNGKATLKITNGLSAGINYYKERYSMMRVITWIHGPEPGEQLMELQVARVLQVIKTFLKLQ